MLQKVLVLFFGLFFLFPTLPVFEAEANSAVVETVAPGIIMRGGQTEVRMVSEEVSILAPSFTSPPESSSLAQVDCLFVLKNQGSSPEKIEVGFPLRARMPDDPYFGTEISALQLSVAGAAISFEKKMEEIEIEDGTRLFPWATWTMEFAVDERKELSVSYQVPFLGREQASVYYVLTTGSTWKGTIGNGKIKFSWDGLTSPEQLFGLSLPPDLSEYSDEGSTLIWEFTDWEPDRDLSFYLMSPQITERLLPLLEAADRASSEADRHRRRALVYLLVACGPYFWEEQNPYLVPPRPTNFALVARAQDEVNLASSLDSGNSLDYFLSALTLASWRMKEKIEEPDYSAALARVEKGLALDPLSPLGKYLKSLLLVSQAAQLLNQGEVEKAALVSEEALPNLDVDAASLLLWFWSPSLDMERGVPPEKIRVTTFLKGDGSGYREAEFCPRPSGNVWIHDLLKGFLPLSSLYSWEWRDFKERYPLCSYTSTTLSIRLDFSNPQELRNETLGLESDDLPLREPANEFLRDLLVCGTIESKETGYAVFLEREPQSNFRTSTFALTRELIEGQDNFPAEPLGGVPVPQSLKRLALETLGRMEERLIGALKEQSIELVFLFDSNNDGTAETQKSFLISPEEELAAQFLLIPPSTEVFPSGSTEEWLAPLLICFLALLFGFSLGQVISRRRKLLGEEVVILALFLLLLGLGVVYVLRQGPWLWTLTLSSAVGIIFGFFLAFFLRRAEEFPKN